MLFRFSRISVSNVCALLNCSANLVVNAAILSPNKIPSSSSFIIHTQRPELVEQSLIVNGLMGASNV